MMVRVMMVEMMLNCNESHKLGITNRNKFCKLTRLPRASKAIRPLFPLLFRSQSADGHGMNFG